MEKVLVNNLWKIAYLYYHRVAPCSIELGGDGKAWFYFEDTEALRETQKAFHADEWLQGYIRAQKQMKKDIKAVKRGGGAL
jgi:hypothetical protein